MEERKGWRGQDESQIIGEEKRNGRLVGAAETSKERAEWRRLQPKNLNILGLPKKKSGLSATKRAVGKYAGAAIVSSALYAIPSTTDSSSRWWVSGKEVLAALKSFMKSLADEWVGLDSEANFIIASFLY